MRTTVILDPDTERTIRERMRADGVSFNRALNDAIRDSLTGRPPRVGFSTRAMSLGRPALDLVSALQVAGDLEDEDLMRRMRSAS